MRNGAKGFGVFDLRKSVASDELVNKKITNCVSVQIERTAAIVYVYDREDRTYYKGINLSFRSVYEDIRERYVNSGPLLPEHCAKRLAYLIYTGLTDKVASVTGQRQKFIRRKAGAV